MSMRWKSFAAENDVVLREPQSNLKRAFAALAAMPNDFMSHGRQDQPPQKQSPSQPKVQTVRVYISSGGMELITLGSVEK